MDNILFTMGALSAPTFMHVNVISVLGHLQNYKQSETFLDSFC